jgi:hypothetical protein
VTTAEQQRIAELEREVRELRRANEILKPASAFFAAELDPRLPRKLQIIRQFVTHLGECTPVLDWAGSKRSDGPPRPTLSPESGIARLVGASQPLVR